MKTTKKKKRQTAAKSYLPSWLMRALAHEIIRAFLEWLVT